MTAHDGVSGWPSLLPAWRRRRSLKRVLSPLPQTATCCIAAWSGSSLIGLLLGETGHRDQPPIRRLLQVIRPPLAFVPRPLRRLLRSAAYARPPGNAGYILALAVHPAWQRHRIGLRLLQTLYRHYPAMDWVAHTDHAGSYALFLKAGFEDIVQTEAEGLLIRTVKRP